MDANIESVITSLQNDVAYFARDKAVLVGKLTTANKQLEKYKELVAGYEDKEMAENLKEEANAK